MDDNIRDRATWLMMQVGECGVDPNEFIAQYMASYVVSGGISNIDAFSDLARLLGRTTDLIADERQIWPGLLPGGLPLIDPYKIVPMDHITVPADFASRLRRIADDTINFVEKGFTD